MINPRQITNFNRTTNELEEFALFCIAVAGKNAASTARALDKLLEIGRSRSLDLSPFQIIRDIIKYSDLASLMKNCGIGCYTVKSRGFAQIVSCGLDLRTVTLDQLLNLFGVGHKTARFFLLHSRPNQRYAVLDTHILKYMGEQGIETPKSTPTGKRYLELEQKFLELADLNSITPADMDLQIWVKYANNL